MAASPSTAPGVNKSFARCFIVFIVICILLEGAVYLGLSIWGLLIKSCLVQDTSALDPFSVFKVVMQLVYFNDQTCDIKFTFDNDEVEFLQGEGATPVTKRTYIFFIVYACVSALWVLTSVIALVGLCSPPTRKAQLGCFLPFLLAVVAGSILDVVATAFFAIDISKTMTFESAMDYLDIKYRVSVDGNTVEGNEFPQELNKLNPFMFVPSVVLTCISSRVVIIWILNIIGAAFVFSLSKELIDPDENRQNIQHFASENPGANPQVQRLNSRKEAPPQTHPKPIYQTQPAIFEEVQNQPEIRRVISYEPVEGVRRLETRSVEPLKSPEQMEFERQRSISPVPIPIRQQMNRQQSGLSKREPTFDQQSPYEAQPASPSRPITIQQQLSVDSPLNYRYSTQDGFNSNLQGHNDEEKYGQLPWSYSKDLGDVLKARQQIMTNPNRNSDMPIIPVPDYTLHPNRRDNRNHTSITNLNYG